MHLAATRVVSWKSTDDELPIEADQRHRLARLMQSDQATDRDLAAIKAALGRQPPPARHEQAASEVNGTDHDQDL
jgi:hypothetical protein